MLISVKLVRLLFSEIQFCSESELEDFFYQELFETNPDDDEELSLLSFSWFLEEHSSE